nr:MAG TPA: CREB-binding protein [Caudoviricetes sp.]
MSCYKLFFFHKFLSFKNLSNSYRKILYKFSQHIYNVVI